MRHRRPTVLAAAAVALAGAIGGCSDDDSPSASPTTTAPATATTGAAVLPDDEGLADEGIGALDEVARSLLIQEGELGDPPLADAGYTPGASVALCGDPIDDGHPADVLVGVVLTDEATTVVEELRVYTDADAASAAYDAAIGAGACGPSTVAPSEVDGDRSAVFRPDGAGAFVVAQIADTVLAFHVTGDGLDPVEVAAFGVGKVAAALEN